MVMNNTCVDIHIVPLLSTELRFLITYFNQFRCQSSCLSTVHVRTHYSTLYSFMMRNM